jgi:hypothetical protein
MRRTNGASKGFSSFVTFRQRCACAKAAEPPGRLKGSSGGLYALPMR